MRISDFEGDQALDVLADIIEPAAELFSDPKVLELYKSKKLFKAVAVAIKEHKEAVTTILARLDGEDPKNYKVKLVTLPVKLLEVLNDPDLVNLFTSQAQTATSSGSATENTEGHDD